MPEPGHDPQARDTHIPTIGLLGAPGSGKSTIARLFEREGCAVIDADQLAREAFTDPAIRGKLAEWWGDEVLQAGEVDRARIGRIVFDNPDERQRLEGLVHPYVKRRRDEAHTRLRSAEERPVAIVEDCPLLLEAGLEQGCDALVFVDCPLEVRRERVLASRGWSAEDLAARDAAQWPLDTKRARADYSIRNVADPEAILRRVRDVLQDILQADARARASRAPRV